MLRFVQGARCARRSRGWPVAIALAASPWAAQSYADEGTSAHCRHVEAVAQSEAALLYAPRVEIQGVRFPQNGAVDTSALVGDDFQLRAALAYSPLDAYRGTRVMQVAHAECAQHETERSVDDVLIAAANAGRGPALRRAADFLDGARDQWKAIERRATEETLHLRASPRVRPKG